MISSVDLENVCRTMTVVISKPGKDLVCSLGAMAATINSIASAIRFFYNLKEYVSVSRERVCVENKVRNNVTVDKKAAVASAKALMEYQRKYLAKMGKSGLEALVSIVVVYMSLSTLNAC